MLLNPNPQSQILEPYRTQDSNSFNLSPAPHIEHQSVRSVEAGEFVMLFRNIPQNTALISTSAPDGKPTTF